MYDALVKAKKQLCFNLGSFPEIVILGCGPAPEIVAVKVIMYSSPCTCHRIGN